MKALILAAGMGTRLMPLTETKPKALIRINGVTLLEIAIRKISMEGFSDIIVNIHHFPNQVVEFIRQLKLPGVDISISDETNKLLDTGGAILNARWFLDGKKPFLVYNVDVISEISLDDLYNYHIRLGSLATLAVSERLTSRYLLFDETDRMKGWKDVSGNIIRWAGKPPVHFRPLAFSGIHILDPSIFELIQETGKYSIIDLYLRLADSHAIRAFDHTGTAWFDVGKPEQLTVVSGYLANNPQYLSRA